MLPAERRTKVDLVSGHYGTALVAAAANDRREIVKMLLEAGADTAIQCGEYGTALHAALGYGHQDIIALLDVKRFPPTKRRVFGIKIP